MPNRPSFLSRDLLGFGLGFIGVVIFGATLPVTREALTAFSPWFIAPARASIGGLLALIVLVILRRPFPAKDLWKPLILASIGTTVGFPMFSALALQTVPSSHGAVVLGILPLLTAVMGALVSHERPSARFWLISIIGCGLVVAFSLRNAQPGFGHGDLFLLLACIAASSGYAYFAEVTRRITGWEAISWALIIGLPINAPLALALFQPGYVNAPLPAVLCLGYLSFFSMYIGFFFWNAGLAIGGTGRVGQVQLLQTFVTIAIAASTMGEAITVETFGFAIAVAIVVLLARKARVARKEPAPAV